MPERRPVILLRTGERWMTESGSVGLASVVVILGGLFSLLGAIGVWRLRDGFSRLHAASKAGAFGAMLCLGAAWIASPSVAGAALVAVVVLLLASPLAAHVLARAAWLAGERPVCGLVGNALDERNAGERKEQAGE